VAGGEKFNKLFFAVVNWVHDLCAAIMKEGGGEEEMGMDVRVMWGRKYVDEDGCVCCLVQQDTVMVWMNMFVFGLVH
jgi:predicted lactoylglutathione lyase